MEFSRQESWSGLPFPSPGDLPDPGIEPWSSVLQMAGTSNREVPVRVKGCLFPKTTFVFLPSLFLTFSLLPLFLSFCVSILFYLHNCLLPSKECFLNLTGKMNHRFSKFFLCFWKQMSCREHVLCPLSLLGSFLLLISCNCLLYYCLRQ